MVRGFGWAVFCVAMGMAVGACSSGDRPPRELVRYQLSGMEDDSTGEADYLIEFGVISSVAAAWYRPPSRTRAAGS